MCVIPNNPNQDVTLTISSDNGTTFTGQGRLGKFNLPFEIDGSWTTRSVSRSMTSNLTVLGTSFKCIANLSSDSLTWNITSEPAKYAFNLTRSLPSSGMFGAKEVALLRFVLDYLMSASTPDCCNFFGAGDTVLSSFSMILRCLTTFVSKSLT